MSIYENQIFIPMLLSKIKKPFNDPNYIFELKFDGIRVLLFLEPGKITIRTRRGIILNNNFPELLNIKNYVKKKVVFDGEIVTIINGKPDFEKVKKRVLIKNKSKITYYAKSFPAIFIVFDILYENEDLTNLPLIERKKILDKYKNKDNFIKAEYIEKYGKDLYEFVVENNLEGIVAKKIDSKYQINKRSKNWIKIKNVMDEDYYICGFKEEENNAVASLLLGKKIKNNMKFVGSVVIGKKNPEYSLIKKTPIDKNPLIKKEGYINIIPSLECTIEFIEKTKKGGLRQPKYKGLKQKDDLCG